MSYSLKVLLRVSSISLWFYVLCSMSLYDIITGAMQVGACLQVRALCAAAMCYGLQDWLPLDGLLSLASQRGEKAVRPCKLKD